MEQHIHGPAPEGSADRRLARLASARHGVFTRAEALAAGAGRGLIEWRVATSRWESLHPGIYRIAGTPETWRQRLLAACLVSGSDAVASHRAAASLRQIPGIAEGFIEISVPNGRRIRRAGILTHRTAALEPPDVMVVDAIPTTTPTRTLIDLAAVLPAGILEEALDDALRRRLTTVPRLRRRLYELGPRGRAGARALGALLEARGGGAAIPESVLETRFLRMLRRARLRLPICQYPIHEQGRRVAVVDFAWPDVRLAVEADGYRWHSGRVRWSRDLARRNAITTLGWRLIHVTWSDVNKRPEMIVGMIAGALGATPMMLASSHKGPRARP